MADILYNRESVSIIGAGGLAREIETWIAGDANSVFSVIGFWDDNLLALSKYDIAKKVLGKVEPSQMSGSVLMGIMDCHIKHSLFERIIEFNPSLTVKSYIHNSVLIGSRTTLGEGIVLFPNVIVSCDVHIGLGCFINLGSQIGHDSSIGNFVSIMPNVDIGGGVEIGDNVFIGSGATILPGVKISANTRIGAGSVVIKSIKKEGTYFGNPAKRIF